ncbi:M20/M25/M40 family metallo-hydrolase, partial [Terriglobus sp. YAF25]|uniref:tRNA pseudouridine synthase A n=1 Tax=Terriglobus sp. YAF25 TaxID=3233080 RepID=UPI003F966739
MAFSRNTWKLILSYDGGDFHGWQVQPGLRTVQGLLSEAIRKVTGEEVLPQGSGRTDAGVHALGQVATFDLEAGIPQQNLLRALNRALPTSVRVTQAEIMPQDFHARHSACGKTYEYRIFVRRDAGTPHERICSPLVARYVWDCRWPLDIAPMQQAATSVVGEMDFSSFAANDPDVSVRQGATPPTMVRTISSSEWRREGDHRAAWVRDRFVELGLEQVQIDAEGNVLGELPGEVRNGPVTMLSAHLDTIFPDEMLPEPRLEEGRVYAPGAADNVAGLTGLLAVAAAMKAAQLVPAHTILFAANVGEEAEGNLRGMRHLFFRSEYA